MERYKKQFKEEDITIPYVVSYVVNYLKKNLKNMSEIEEGKYIHGSDRYGYLIFKVKEKNTIFNFSFSGNFKSLNFDLRKVDERTDPILYSFSKQNIQSKNDILQECRKLKTFIENF